jgi:hypothetical protein
MFHPLVTNIRSLVKEIWFVIQQSNLQQTTCGLRIQEAIQLLEENHWNGNDTYNPASQIKKKLDDAMAQAENTPADMKEKIKAVILLSQPLVNAYVAHMLPKPITDEYVRAIDELTCLIGTLKSLDKETSQCSLLLIAALTFLQQKNFGSVFTTLQTAYAKVLLLKKPGKKSAVRQTTGTLLTSGLTSTKTYLQDYITLIIGMVKNIPAPATSAVSTKAIGNPRAQLRLMRACLDAQEALF